MFTVYTMFTVQCVYSEFHQSVKFIQYTDMDYKYHIHIIISKNKVLNHVSHGNMNLIYELDYY